MNVNTMREYSNIFKENIEELINSGYLSEAKNYIHEYELLQQDDCDLFSMKGIIELAEGNLDVARSLFLEGLERRPYDVHLLYNLAYVYELKKEYINSYRQYKKLEKLVGNDLTEAVLSKIVELKSLSQVSEYVKRKKVLIIAYIFPPLGGSGVQRTLKFVKYLREFGWEPIVLTIGDAQTSLIDHTLELEIPEEIELIRISENVEIDLNYINKLVEIYQTVVNKDELLIQYVDALNTNPELINKYALLPEPAIVFVKEALDVIGDKVDFKEIDLIYSTSGPYSDHLLGNLLQSRFQKKWIVDFRDEWTNNPYFNYDRDDLIYKMFREMEQNILNTCDKVLAITSHAKSNYIHDFNINENKIVTITNGYDEEDFTQLALKQTGLKKDKFRIMHNGLLYMIRTPETFFRAISNLVEKEAIPKDSIEILFTQTDDDMKWKELAQDLNIADTVTFLGYLDHQKSLAYAYESDLLLLIVGPGEQNKSVYTGKIFEYLRMGKRILSLSPRDSLVEELIVTTNRGRNFDFYDVENIEEYILSMYKLWEEDSYSDLDKNNTIERFERRELTKTLSGVFDEVASSIKLTTVQLQEENDEFYNKAFESGGWDETYFKHYSETHYFDIWKRATEIIQSYDNPKVFDIGCGPGQFANLLFDNKITNYTGMDFSSEAIKHAKIRNDKLRSLFYVDDVYKTKLFSRDYNFAVLFEILEHLNDDLGILNKLKTGTEVLFSVPNFYSEGHVRWFDSQLEVAQRYSSIVEIKEICPFNVGGYNKIFLVHSEKK
ncbi:MULTISPECIES: methyltransferase domain-containing protein [Paenibacillus]|uniref:methyltransferase domain-containing protein n=1 Tax=Paenibacillus TaxID=44249 RepID=UPI0013791A21|nr:MULTISPECIES: methyltransferase domain-containing protein [Paenibacillus]KAF6587335.1 methyltransferase domain-containing protein [Paenibacillus sp. EKM211P]